jgi:hypothetical protein
MRNECWRMEGLRRSGGQMSRRQRFDALAIVAGLDRVAARMRRLGLRRLTRWGRHLVGRVVGESLSVEVDGLRMAGSVEHRGHMELVRQGRYEPFTTELFKSCLRAGMTVVDIGAQLGYFTLLAGQAVQSEGRVYAFEPDPRTFPLIGW